MDQGGSGVVNKILTTTVKAGFLKKTTDYTNRRETKEYGDDTGFGFLGGFRLNAKASETKDISTDD